MYEITDVTLLITQTLIMMILFVHKSEDCWHFNSRWMLCSVDTLHISTSGWWLIPEQMRNTSVELEVERRDSYSTLNLSFSSTFTSLITQPIGPERTNEIYFKEKNFYKKSNIQLFLSKHVLHSSEPLVLENNWQMHGKLKLFNYDQLFPFAFRTLFFAIFCQLMLWDRNQK